MALGQNNCGVMYSIVACKHLEIDPFAYLHEALTWFFELGGEKPTSEQLLNWLTDRWLLNQSIPSVTAR
jgi:hypothetical protein